MKTFTVSKPCSLKEFTDTTYPQGSFYFNLLLKKRDIKVNGVRTGNDVALNAGDEVAFYTTPAQEAKPSHFILFEDGNVLIADKVSGVSSEGLLSELCEKGTYFAVHRLDRNTQGILVFAKTKQAEEELLSAFKDRSVQKTYLALCKNKFKANSGILTAFLLKNEESSLVKVCDTARNGAVKIVTEYSVLEYRGDIALVQIILHTGKTHQIRAHMAHIGCPVLGDGKYGDTALNKKYKVSRQCLVAKQIVFGIDGSLSYLNNQIFQSGFMPETRD